MKKPNFKPGELLGMLKSGDSKKMKRAMKMSGIKHSGEFHGKSNALGQGGRAAQLKARGVPGGVIGNLARAAHAAPGQANFHKKTKKGATKEMYEGAMKKAHKKHKKAEGEDESKNFKKCKSCGQEMKKAHKHAKKTEGKEQMGKGEEMKKAKKKSK